MTRSWRGRIWSDAPHKSIELLSDRLRGRLVEAAGPALDSCRFDTRDLCRTHDGWCGKSGACQIVNGHVAWPGRVVGAGDHGHPDQPERSETPAGDNQRWTPLFGQAVPIGKRHHDNFEGVEAIPFKPAS